MSYQQSNSGGGACRVTKTGRRKDTVRQAVEVVAKHPGIDSFTGSYVQAGGPLEYEQGQWKLSGKTSHLTPDELALVLKFQSRITEAKQKGYIVESARCVQRSVSAAGYRVTEKGKGFIGGGSFPDPSLKVSDKPVVPQLQPAGCGKPDKKREKNESKPVDFASLASNNIGNLMKDLK